MARTRSAMPALLLLAAMMGLAAAQDPMLDSADSFVPLGETFDVTLSNYGGPFDGVDAAAARSGTGRMFGVLNGGCGYEKVPKDSYPWLHAVAFDPTCAGIQGIPAGACGSCWRFTCHAGKPGCGPETKSIVAKVTDACPGCNKKFASGCHADMHFASFEKIATVTPDGGGLAYGVTAERVACQVPGYVNLRVLDNLGGDKWLRAMFWRAAGPGAIKAADMVCGGERVTMQNRWGAVWEVSNQPSTRTCTFELTDDKNELLVSHPIDLSQYEGENMEMDVPFLDNFGSADASTSTTDTTQTADLSSFGAGGLGGSQGSASSAPVPAPQSDSWTPPPAAAPAASSWGGCADDAPPNESGVVEFTCAQQKEWGKCDEGWMAGWCKATCGRC